jgi:hypothetical protein
MRLLSRLAERAMALAGEPLDDQAAVAALAACWRGDPGELVRAQAACLAASADTATLWQRGRAIALLEQLALRHQGT